MPTLTRWAVRVIDWEGYTDHLPLAWVDILTYMGYARELAKYPATRTSAAYSVIEFYGPNPDGPPSKHWADKVVDLMQKYGINAVAAPAWPSSSKWIDSKGERHA